MNKTVIILTGIAVIFGVGYYLYTTQTSTPWTWELEPGCETDINVVTFEQEMFDCLDSSEPHIVLDSIMGLSGEVWIFQYQNGALTSWSSERWEQGYPNELSEILSDIPSNICVSIYCTLTIERC